VPLTNFAGWMLTTLVIYGGFAGWRARSGVAVALRPTPALLAVLAYAAVALAGIWRNLHGMAREVVLADGSTWQSADIFQAMTIVTAFTMLFVVLLALVALGSREARLCRVPP
jgi:hypothetical protein